MTMRIGLVEGEIESFKRAHGLVELMTQCVERLVVLGFGAAHLGKKLRLLLLEFISKLCELG